MESVQNLEKISQDLKAHHHGALDRSKYPDDYDSSSDYEVKKLREVMHHIDDIKKHISNLSKPKIEKTKPHIVDNSVNS